MTDTTELAQRMKAAAVRAKTATEEYASGHMSVSVCYAECEEFNRLTDGPDNILALVEALELKEEQRANWFQMAQKLGEDLDAAEKRIAELESEVKFPGVMRCNACGFSRTHIIATPDGMRAGKSEPENCPNGCGPMWHDTYRRQYDELHDAYTALRESNAQVIQSRDHYKRMTEEGLKQLAESRTVTVKMPKLKMLEDYLAEVAVEERKAILLSVRMEFHRALTAAGIKWEAE
ncbi:hypothetical protein ABN154_22975 [Klebsiella michiganensis]|uniref:hypothetical protein n=1 Tax=Klebsiella michiganensis TaxID=1134687 RepID=UPI0032D9F1A7